ncbi:unnamed protein product [Caenorhabditis sp. 36 PRJEB53466]|nr:unnamed protein product [Caenorhabditis sp. 36 PRJEB53466]
MRTFVALLCVLFSCCFANNSSTSTSPTTVVQSTTNEIVTTTTSRATDPGITTEIITTSTHPSTTPPAPPNSSISFSTLVHRTSSTLPPPKNEKVYVKCPKGSLTEYGTEGSGKSGSCNSAEECLKVGPASNMSLRLDVTCVFNPDQTASRCCYRDTSHFCSQGVSILPSEKCETIDDCNTREVHTTQRWCDPVSKMCCRNQYKEEHELYCADGVTALMNEPICAGYKPGNMNSGICPIPFGVCLHGHCCPPVYEKSIENAFEGTPYRTNTKCSNSTVIDEKQIGGYCDPETARVFIMGADNFHGQPNKQIHFFCLTSRDCGQTFGKDNVCVRLKRRTQACFVDPNFEYYIPKKPNLVLISTVSFVALGTSLLALLFSVLYRTLERDDSFPGEASESQRPLISQRGSAQS